MGTITNLGALPGHEDTSHWPDVQLYQIFLWVGWGGVGWGGVGTITNLAALHGPEDYAGRLLICINIFLWVGWGGVGRGQQQALPPHRDLTTTLGGFSFVQISSFGWVGLGWGWVDTITNLGALPGHEDTSHWPDVKLYQIFVWVGWGGVGWGGVGWGQ